MDQWCSTGGIFAPQGTFDDVWTSLMAQMVKKPPAMQETWVRSQGWEDPLEEDMATNSSIFAWRILWTEELDRLQFMGLQRIGHDCD